MSSETPSPSGVSPAIMRRTSLFIVATILLGSPLETAGLPFPRPGRVAACRFPEARPSRRGPEEAGPVPAGARAPSPQIVLSPAPSPQSSQLMPSGHLLQEAFPDFTDGLGMGMPFPGPPGGREEPYGALGWPGGSCAGRGHGLQPQGAKVGLQEAWGWNPVFPLSCCELSGLSFSVYEAG